MASQAGAFPNRKIVKINELKRIKKGCPLAKFTKLSYTESELRAKSPFELVHIDIWGPYKMETKGKYRFLLTMVDDNTRVTWMMHLLKLKSDVYEATKSFVHMAGTRFEGKVKIIKSHNALEFDDKQFKPFFSQLGIIHQTSSVERPPQNEMVERKHRNILEMGRAMRFKVGFPCNFKESIY